VGGVGGGRVGAGRCGVELAGAVGSKRHQASHGVTEALQRGFCRCAAMRPAVRGGRGAGAEPARGGRATCDKNARPYSSIDNHPSLPW
jgi:hypothetical protein